MRRPAHASRDMSRDLRVLHRCADPKGPAERLAADGELEALGRGVQMRSTTRCRPPDVGDHRDRWTRVARDDPDQIGDGRLLPAPDARTHRGGANREGNRQLNDHRRAV